MVLLALHYLLLGGALYALVDAGTRPAAAWAYVGVSRGKWLALLGVATLVAALSSMVLGLLGIASAIVILIYLLEHRPRLREVPRPRRTTLPPGPSPWS